MWLYLLPALEMEPVKVFIDPTGKFQNHRRLTGRSTGFFVEGFCSRFNVSNEKFSKGVGMGEMLKFVTLNGGFRKKKRKKIFRFLQK